jgi:RHS repeat-associated protein
MKKIAWWHILLTCCCLWAQQPGDVNGDGSVSDADSTALLNALLSDGTIPASADCNLDGVVDFLDVVCILNRRAPQVSATFPAADETGVATTRETRIDFTLPIDAATVAGAYEVVSEGDPLTVTPHVSPDGLSLTLFYPDQLPDSSIVSVSLNGDVLQSVYGIPVDVDGDGVPGGQLSFPFETLGIDVIAGTVVVGRVFASEPLADAEGFVDQGLAGVTITVDGAEDTLRTTTDALGNFRLDPAPAGRFFVHIDGRTASGVPAGSYYPFVGKAWESVPGQEVSVGNVFLPLIIDGTLQTVSTTQTTEIAFPMGVLDERPELAGTMLMVPPDSLFADNGSRGGMVGIAPVDPERLPGALPSTLPLPLVITVQTDGPTNFDQPVPVCFPNLPDPITGEIALPGSASALVSFNHDTGRFEVVGSMTVSDDGQLVCTDPGEGILAPGWHGNRAGTSGGGGRNTGGSGGSGGSGGNNNNNNNNDPQEEEEREEEEEKGQESPPPAAPPSNPPAGGPEPNCPKEEEDEPDDTQDPVDPVYLFSGEFYHEETDLRIPGRGFDFVWARKYRGKLALNSAIGNSWDFSYNIKLTRDDCGQIDPGDCPLILYDGNSRRDRYRPGVDGSYTRNEFFRKLDEQPDGSFVMVFANRGEWHFGALDGSPAEGKITAILDRNGNTMNFAYDGLGRLTTITDTLGRDITVGYASGAADARITTVTDFAGRVLRYQHYDGNSAEGNEGDLASFTQPVVTGTPNGNDFPNGKTTIYTYQKESAQVPDRLWGNLLTITDARRNDPNDATFGDGPWLVNTYDASDRLVKQIWGGDVVDVSYNPVFPSRANGMAVMRTIVNDRKGHVKEFWWDERNRCVLKREYTGTANPTEATTPTSNRPTNPLRSDDPVAFDTRYSWNMDSLKSRVTHPNGDVTEYIYERDVNPNASVRVRGNLVMVRHLPGPLAGDQTVIEEAYSYDDDFGGGCCSFDFVTSYTDGRGNTITYEYDNAGNLVRETERISGIVTEYEYNAFGQVIARTLPDNGSGHRRRDTFDYYTSGPQTGYQRQLIIDAGGLNLTTAFEYDQVGNIISVTDPMGNDSLYQRNSLNQVVRFSSREVSAGGVRHVKDYAYDANNNLVRIDVENRDADGVLQDNTHFTATYEYEVLNRRIRKTEEVAEDHAITTEYAYDANRNRILVRNGEAVNGNQPNNTSAYVYDERDLLFQEILAPEDAARSTTQRDYDGNGNLIRVTRGLEGTPRITTHAFDGFNRRVETQDAMGNRIVRNYDANSNIVRRRNFGERIDLPGDRDNVVLRDVSMTYDALNRRTRIDHQFFDTETLTPIGDGMATTSRSYTDTSAILQETDDNGHTHTLEYDTANRVSRKIDSLNNTETYTYNANSQIIATEDVERSTVGGADEIYVSFLEYDGLDRLIREIDSGGNIRDYAYDSRNNLTRFIDALRPDNANDPGNLIRYDYDGLSRRTATHRVLTDDGSGAGVAVGEISTRILWDDSSRLVARIDDSGNETRMTFDALNRKQTVIYADGTTLQRSYDAHHNLIGYEDANGNQVTLNYDLANRQIGRTVQPGPGVSDQTTFESLRYDGLSRLVSGEDNDSTLVFQYDSLSRIVSETLNGQETRRVLDGVGNNTETTYPGGLVITNTFDALDRLATISSSEGMSANYGYIGPRRTVQRDHGNQTRMTMAYDSARRPAETRHVFRPDQENQTFDHRTYTWDRMNNKSMNRDELTLNETTYTYDSVYRMVAAEDAFDGAPIASRSYGFDSVGNRETVTGGLDPGNYTLSNSTPEPNDAVMNQYTTTPFEVRTYDANGNLTAQEDDQVVTTVYNYRNRPVLRQISGESQQQRYRYDVLGRRIEKSFGETVTRYFYDGDKVAEEQDGSGQTTAAYVYGVYLDEVLAMHRDDALFYFHQDDLYNVVKATNAAGSVVEAYTYDDYGTPSLFNGTGQQISTTAIGNPYLFTGRRFDFESELYYSRFRYYDSRSGRFTTRDPIGIWGDSINMGNGYTYAGNNPRSLLDPFGLFCAGDPMVDDPKFREMVEKALEAMEGHEPYESETPEESCGDDDPDYPKPSYEGTTLRETYFTGTGTNGNYEFSEIGVGDPVGAGIPYNPNQTCRLHTHPNHETGYDNPFGEPFPSGADRATNAYYPVDNDFVATEDYLARYDKFGNITDMWRIDDLKEPCCKK